MITANGEGAGRAASGVTPHNGRPGYMPTLDGWRCVAIVGVLLFHDHERRIGLFSTHVPHQLGDLGVALFFAISGLLITSRILEEERLVGAFHIRDFYVRRAFRILPAVLLFLAVLVGLHVVIGLPLGTRGVVASVFFVRNLTGDIHNLLADWFTGHCWSLSIEEQFYLVLPAFLLVVRSRRQRLWLLASGAIVAFVWTSYIAPHVLVDLYRSITSQTELHVHGILGGCSLAVVIASVADRDKVRRLLQPGLCVAVVAVLALAMFVSRPKSLPAPRLEMEAFFPFLILSTVLNPESILSRVLETSAVRYVGRMSYGIYLWQQVFFVPPSVLHPSPYPWMNRFPLSYVLTFCCAGVSFYLVEKPLMRLGHRMARPPTPGRGDLGEVAATG